MAEFYAQMTVIYGPQRDGILKYGESILEGAKQSSEPNHPAAVAARSFMAKFKDAEDGAVLNLTHDEYKSYTSIEDMRKSLDDRGESLVDIALRSYGGDSEGNVPFGTGPWKEKLNELVDMLMDPKVPPAVKDPKKLADLVVLKKDIASSPNDKLVFSGDGSRTAFVAISMAVATASREVSNAEVH